jgi:hypothetical protein
MVPFWRTARGVPATRAPRLECDFYRLVHAEQGKEEAEANCFGHRRGRLQGSSLISIEQHKPFHALYQVQNIA